MIKPWSKILILIIVTALVFSGCKNYKLLSVFFDGVKDPNKTVAVKSTHVVAKADSTQKVNASTNAATQFIHEPYNGRGCSNCHDSKAQSKLNTPQPDLCYNCHSNFKDKFKVIHGPVAGGFCTSCHNPHMADNKKLLVKSGQAMCTGCHLKAEVLKNEVHTDIAETSCTECHNPHGGSDKNLLN